MFISGLVTSFNRAKEYGFMRQCDIQGGTLRTSGDDVFFHINNIDPLSLRYVNIGSVLHFEIIETDKGSKAINISSPLQSSQQKTNNILFS